MARGTARIGLTERPIEIFVVVAIAATCATFPIAWWPGKLLAAAGALLILAVGLITMYGRTLIGWLTNRMHEAWKSRSARMAIARTRTAKHAAAPGPALGAAGEADPGADTSADAGGHEDKSVRIHKIAGITVAVAIEGPDLVAVIRLDGPALLPRLIHAGTVQAPQARIPLDTIEAAMAELREGQPYSYDIAFNCRRLADTRYASTYDHVQAGRAIGGQRTAYLITRYRPQAAPWYFGARPDTAHAVAANTVRLSRAIATAGCANEPLDAVGLAALKNETAYVGVPQWRNIAPESPGGLHEATYLIDPGQLTSEDLAELWATRAQQVLVTLHHGPQGWHGFVRLRTNSPDPAPPLAMLHPLPGQQSVAAAYGYPGATPEPVIPYPPVASLAALDLPAGSDGQILCVDGQGTSVLASLVPAPRRHTIALLSEIPAAQLLVRAAANGADVTVITDRPRQWQHLVREGVKLSPGTPEKATWAALFVYDGLQSDLVPTDSDASIVLLNPDDIVNPKPAPAAADGSPAPEEKPDDRDPIVKLLDRAGLVLWEDPASGSMAVGSSHGLYVGHIRVDPSEVPHLRPLQQETMR
ncbi:hypothetical protein PP352_21505 [Mycobacteroides abscessus]|nr:hypothetical protein [Mycobacteroides abscessus]